MAEVAIKLERKSERSFLDDLKDIVPAGNLSLCLTCGLCSSGCPATGLDGMDPRKFLRMLVLGMDEEVMQSDWPWMCTMCQRCVYVCPMKIDIPQLVFNVRAARPRDERPKGIRGSCDVAVQSDTCSAMGTPVEDFKFVVNDVLEEYRESQPEFADMLAPIDKEGAEFFINQNSREPMTEPDEMVPLWKILHLAGVDWTYSSKAWAAENYCLFLADNENWEHLVRKKAAQADALRCKTYLNTEWGHITFAVRAGLKKFNIEHNFETKNIYEYYAKWIREGKLKPNSDWNKDLKVKFTVQDPCQIVRKSFGDAIAEDFRFAIKQAIGEENLVEMWPNKSNNYCCGGGGGFLQSGFKDQRLEYGRLKDEQIKTSGATYCIAGCHNCHAQIHELSHHYGGHYHVVHFWTILALSLGILGPNERTYLGDDLKDVNVFHPETAL